MVQRRSAPVRPAPLSIVKWPNAEGAALKVYEIARAEVGGKVFEARRQARRVHVEFSPQVYAAIESVVSFKDQPASEFSLHPDVCLVTLRNAEAQTEPARKAGIEHAKISDERRVDR